MPCTDCGTVACETCTLAHRTEAQIIVEDLQHLAANRRDFLQSVLDAATLLKKYLGAEMAQSVVRLTPGERALIGEIDGPIRSVTSEIERLHRRHVEALMRCQHSDLIREADVLLDFEVMRRRLVGMGEAPSSASSTTASEDPMLFLTNFCMFLLYGRVRNMPLPYDNISNDASTLQADSDTSEKNLNSASEAVGSLSLCNPSVSSTHPLFYFDLEVKDEILGRVVIEVCDDAAPRMAHNFSVLATGELGMGYQGCTVFQCWDGESVITGDFEQNNGRGGHSVFEENYFIPDDTKMVAVRGAVGMHGTQKRQDSQDLVGSQFRIMLREMKEISAIFARVVEGIELVDKLSRMGDSSGKPHSTIHIVSCGKL